MYCGIYTDYLWDVVDGKLLVSSKDPRIGLLREFEAPTSFNNAEHATWFAQGTIDLHGEELTAALDHKRSRL